jgi:hypothetical protein
VPALASRAGSLAECASAVRRARRRSESRAQSCVRGSVRSEGRHARIESCACWRRLVRCAGLGMCDRAKDETLGSESPARSAATSQSNVPLFRFWPQNIEQTRAGVSASGHANGPIAVSIFSSPE